MTKEIKIIEMGKSPIDNDLLSMIEYIELLKNYIAIAFGIPKELLDNDNEAEEND